MNEEYFRSVIEDRGKEVSEYVDLHQAYRHLSASNQNQQESVGRAWKEMNLRLGMIIKWLRGIASITPEDQVKV